ncbi:MAG TPA: aldehyde dehydrogenase family protein [Candidatus Omnitrophota bacterium]|nr:aldehyde dehydrogenase family protein [Candidatus Omnitrophota bacterium]
MNEKISIPIDVDSIMEKASCAAAVFSQLSQEHTDRIVEAVYRAAFDSRVRLAKLAVEETGIGNWRDKVVKNVVATQLVYHDIKDLKTVGIISEDERKGIVEIAQPLGPIFAVIPVTNPTSTVLFKILIALKTRNPIIIRPHSSAIRCSNEAARICYEAALKEDAPEDCIQWLENTSRTETQVLMQHKKLALILATGGGSLVNAAYSSGTPALGVGAGNVPVFIEQSADVPFAIEQILISKLFDNGTICASEQAVVVERSIAAETMNEFKRKGAHFLSGEEMKRIENVAYDSGKGVMSVGVIGKTALEIAQMAGIEVPPDTRLLIAPLQGIGKDYPISSEILAPILAFYVAEDFKHAVNLCIDLNFHGGIGHTASLFSNDEAKIKEFACVMNAGRVVVNMPASQGAVGGMYNSLYPSFTLGCGTGGKNITTDNITARHLLNIQRISRRRVNQRFERFNKELYFDESLDSEAIEREYNRNF